MKRLLGAMAAILLCGCDGARSASDSTLALPPVGAVQPADSVPPDSARDSTAAVRPAPANAPASPTGAVRPDSVTRRDTTRRDSVIQRRPIRVPTIPDTSPRPPVV